MGLSYTLTITSPNGAHSVKAFPTRIVITGEMSECSIMHMLFEYGWDWYVDEDDTTNPVQTNSLVTLVRTNDNGAQTVWTGYIPARHLIEGGGEGEQVMDIIAYDLMAKLRKTVASIDGDPVFTKTTPAVAITENTFKQGSAIGDTLFPFYPTPSDTDPWVASADCNQTTLYVDGAGGTLAADAVTIIGTTSQGGILPLGIIRIENEWIQYDGYDYSSTSDRYRFKNCVRGALGTTAATHDEDKIIYQRVSQKIHPAHAVVVEGYNVADSAWELLPADYFAVQPEEGRIDFTHDVLDYPTGDSKYNNVRVTYAVFDEDNAAAVNLGGVLTSVLTETRANGGPGFTDGTDLEVGHDVAGENTLDIIKISRVRVEAPTTTLNFIQNLIDELGLAKGTTEDAIGLWYDHPAGKMVVDTIAQKATASADYAYGGMILRDRDISIDDIYSGVLISYFAGQNLNLASVERCWHPQFGDTVGDNSKAVNFIMYQDKEGPQITGYWDNRSQTVGHNNFTDRIFDGQPDSAWGLHVGTGSPGANADILFLHFNDALDTFIIDRIKIILDIREFSHPTDPYHFEIVGVDENYDKADPTNIPDANRIKISGALDLRFKAGDTVALKEVTIEVSDLGVELQGIILRWNGMTTHGKGTAVDGVYYGNTNMRMALVKEIQVEGHLNRTALVSLTNDDGVTEQANLLYAPLTYAKLLRYYDAATHIAPQIDIYKIGQSTYDAAVSLGRLALLQKLAYKAMRFYRMEAYLENYDLPTLGDTAAMSDGFTGVIIGWQFIITSGEETLNLRILDFDDTLV